MDKVLSFIKSPLGKGLMILIAVIIVGYTAFVIYEKSQYNGNTKSSVESAIMSKAAERQIGKVKAEDNNYLTSAYPLADILSWYDENAARTVSISDITDTLNSLGIDGTKLEDFRSLQGKALALVNYV